MISVVIRFLNGKHWKSTSVSGTNVPDTTGKIALKGCTSSAEASALYCHVQVLDSGSGHGEINIHNFRSLVPPPHPAVMSDQVEVAKAVTSNSH